jgi:hypothetical protein
MEEGKTLLDSYNTQDGLLRFEAQHCSELAELCEKKSTLLKRYNSVCHGITILFGTVLSTTSPILSYYENSAETVFILTSVLFPMIVFISFMQLYYDWSRQASIYDTNADIFMGLSSSARDQITLVRDDMDICVYMTNFSLTKKIALKATNLSKTAKAKLYYIDPQSIVIDDCESCKKQQFVTSTEVIQKSDEQEDKNPMKSVMKIVLNGSMGNVRLT